MRQRSAERRQQLIEQPPSSAARERPRQPEAAKARDNLKRQDRPRGDRTIGAAPPARERALVRRGKRRPAVRCCATAAWRNARHARRRQRALAQATFGGRYANRFRDGDRRHWRHRHHRHIHVIGWLGPLFWPYAYDDFVDYTYWPYAYDAFWPYAYDDVYDGFFGPYGVGGPAYADASGRRRRRMSRGGGGVRTGTRTGTGRGPRRAVRPAAARWRRSAPAKPRV